MESISNYIEGRSVSPESGAYLDNYQPDTGAVYGKIPDSGATDVEWAVQAAKNAYPDWSGMPLEDRSRLLMKLSERIEENLDRLAEAESRDTGKPLWLARKVDIPRAAQNFRFFATGLVHFASEAHETVGLAINYTLRRPLGVVGCISPWNLPLYLFTWKIAPALAAGNCVVAKPSEVTPVSAYLLSELCQEIGFPSGVLNIVHGTGENVGSPITEHPDIKGIAFTGGTKTGASIAAKAAPMFKKLSLEMGGKNPNIIFSDCDREATIRSAVRSAFSNQGEICLCGSRIFVQREFYEEFREAFVERTKELKVGDPARNDVDLGAIVSKAHYDKILGHIEGAVKEGGTVLTGGHAVQPEGDQANGWFIRPTVIEGLPNACATNQEEIFGPVATLIPFDTEDEALEMANGVQYGLSGTIWTRDLDKAHRVASHLEAGIIWINCWLLRDLRTPFGGMKASGIGREGGWEAFRFFTEPKNVCVRIR